jgi:Peptidase M15
MIRLLVLLCLLMSLPEPAAAQALGSQVRRFDPAADYVTAGQDEPGYQAWYKAASWRPVYVRAFHDYLVINGVGGVAPTWQLLRTATDWRRCGADPFEVPPSSDWPNIVATLRYIGREVVPALGPVEPVSVYRNPILNACAGGAQASTHREMGAVDVVPLRPIGREALMMQLCRLHAAHPDSNTGLGFYKGLRFHIDARKYREWGTQGVHGGHGCAAVLAEGAAPFNPGAAVAVLPPISAVPTSLVPPPPRDPLAPIAP